MPQSVKGNGDANVKRQTASAFQHPDPFGAQPKIIETPFVVSRLEALPESYHGKLWELIAKTRAEARTASERFPLSFRSAPRARKLLPGRLEGPVKFIAQLKDLWKLTDEQMALLLGFENHEIAKSRLLLEGYWTLSGRDLKDRISHLLMIHYRLDGLLRDNRAENEWLREAKKPLDGRTPLDLLTSGSMENLLVVKDYVIWISER